MSLVRSIRELGLARTGKLVTSAALILMFALLVLFLTKLLGEATRWMPTWTGTLLRVPQPNLHKDMPTTPPVAVV